jgi:hypothetical protein
MKMNDFRINRLSFLQFCFVNDGQLPGTAGVPPASLMKLVPATIFPPDGKMVAGTNFLSG